MNFSDLNEPDRLVTCTQAAHMLGMHPVTLMKYRASSEPDNVVGPHWTKLKTGSIRYSLHELQRFAGIRKEAA